MIKANFSAYSTYVTDSLYQWDVNQVLSVTGLNLTVVPEVHFSNSNTDRAIVRQATMQNRVISVAIPNSLLQDPLRIYAHIGIYDGKTFKVVELVEIPVTPRKRPEDYQIEDSDEELYSFKALENAVANMATKSEANVISARIDTIVANANNTEGNSELVDMRVGARGKTYASAGEAVREQFLTLAAPAPAIEAEDDLNLDHYTAPANYVLALSSGLTPLPDSFIESADVPRYLVVEGFGERIPSLGNIQTWGRQTIYTADGDKAYTRYFSWYYAGECFTFTEWRSVNEYNNHRTLTSNVDLDTLVEPDRYIIATADAANAPFAGAGFLLDISITSYGWVVQEVHGLHNNPCYYYRIGNNPGGVRVNGDGNLQAVWSEWQKVVSDAELSASLQGVLPNRGYVIANMGDSIVGNFSDDTSISVQLAKMTGATTYNFGFGGCRMSTHYAPWGAFSMHALADAIASGDFSAQDTAAQHSEAPDYFPATVETMKALDFSQVDIMTIAYGVNDYTASKGLDNASDAYDIEYYGGALRYAIEKVLTAYPNIRIVLVTPSWCYWPGTEYTSDNRTFNTAQNTLPDFVQKVIEIGNEYHVPVVDTYTGRAINKFNCSAWFDGTDGIHPNAEGRKSIAKLMSKTISGM